MRFRNASIACISLFMVVFATSLHAADDSVAKALADAEAEYMAAKKAGHVWRVIDKSTGSSSAPINKILAKGKEAAEAGNNEEATRIAALVKEMAMLGQQQAKDQANAGPAY